MRVRIIALIIGLAVVAAGAYSLYRTANAGRELILSGTVEATETDLPTVAGGIVKRVYVDEGDSVKKGENLVDIDSQASDAYERVRSPLDGVVLERLVQPEEYAAPHSTVLVIAPLNTLTLTIYVPENRYGQIDLGQMFPVTADSFPGQSFSGTVRYISDRAEYTPRNVQTVDSRQTTVYAVKLSLQEVGDKLKPGMPADVHFSTAS